jgi:uncharacterized protein YajQ (UPF0234 family)
MPSFDIVSEIDNVEVGNAVDNANRELTTRFDFRGEYATFSKVEDNVQMQAEAEFQLQQMLDILRGTCVKRGVDTAAMETKDVVHSGKIYKQLVEFQQGIDQAMAKKIVKLVKDAKIKVQTAIQGEQLRITGKKRDELQQVIALVKEANLGQPFQYKNFRD